MLAGSERLGENHRKLSIVVFVFLNECQRLPIGRFHASDPERTKQIEWHDAQAIQLRNDVSLGSADQIRILLERGVELLVLNSDGVANRARLTLACHRE